MKKNILLICGGGSTEHEISLISAEYIYENLKSNPDFNIFHVTIQKNGVRTDRDGLEVELRRAGEIVWKENGKSVRLHFAVPCIHGPPGETGEIQAVFEMMGLPYLGCGPEASQICFNKITTKLWFNALEINNTPYIFLSENNAESVKKAQEFYDKNQSGFIKAARQGSSVGCYLVKEKSEIPEHLNNAFKLSEQVLMEVTVNARELEIAAYEYDGKINVTIPGEISCPSKFYTYEEKYSNASHTTTEVVAPNLTAEQVKIMQDFARKAFVGLKLKHLSRIDFFLTDDGKIYLNEINTFPGMTPISMFPKMMENNGHKFKDYLTQIITKNARS